VIVCFLGLVFLAAPQVKPQLLAIQDWGAVVSAIPVMFVALVFHNVVPVISYRLGGDATKIKQVGRLMDGASAHAKGGAHDSPPPV
jgi:tyrosine-specific transport protein